MKITPLSLVLQGDLGMEVTFCLLYSREREHLITKRVFKRQESVVLKELPKGAGLEEH